MIMIKNMMMMVMTNMIMMTTRDEVSISEAGWGHPVLNVEQ